MTPAQHSQNIDRLEALHDELISNALFDLEEKAAEIISNLPVKNGNLYDIQAAVFARQELQQSVIDSFLTTADEVVRSYDQATATLIGLYQDLLEDGVLPTTQVDAINQLKQLAFSGFEDVASTHLEVMAREVYQSTLTGRSINESVKSIRHAINGVYIQSNDDDAQALVAFIEEHKDDAAKVVAVDKAIEKLHTIYARDKVGNNLRRYATSYAHDSLMQFSASANVSIGNELGIDKWEYYGDSILDTRDWCRNHEGRIMTTQEIRDEWASSDWQGKQAGDPFIVRGGYNCRHSWVAVVD
jgi:hypothetical protein